MYSEPDYIKLVTAEAWLEETVTTSSRCATGRCGAGRGGGGWCELLSRQLSIR